MIATDATRDAGLERLREFLAKAGRRYRAERNEDRGPGRHDNVSGLSPYLRHGLIHEDEVVAAVLERHSLANADKFVQEVCWRSYFKGWLEARPTVWKRYVDDVTEQYERLEYDTELAQAVAAATEGRTGIACFDHWVRELTTTHYLHNHARMWFASIWVFTLKLPWVLGADFFLRHLLDGDAASNTLSWRWVAGLHTKGKTYLATSSNIARYTGGRFSSTEGLAREAWALEENPLPSPRPLAQLPRPSERKPTGWLITDEDCSSHPVLDVEPAAIAGLAVPERRSPGLVAEPVCRFSRDALSDALVRAGDQFGLASEVVDLNDLENWVERNSLEQVVCSYVPVGPLRDALKAVPIELVEMRRAWDEAFWPHATAGFFKVKKQIPSTLRMLGHAV